MLSSGFSINDLVYSNRNFIDLYEYIIAPLYLLLIYAIVYLIKLRYLKNSPLKKYIVPGITVKIIGAIGVCLIYNYYYKGGDTLVYYNEGRLLSNIFISNPWIGLRLFTSVAGNMPPDIYQYVQLLNYAQVENSFLIVKISGFIQLFTFQSLLITSILFGCFSFVGIWQIFRLFVSYYPQLIKQFAIAFLFLPSVFFWGSGILKDTVCLTSLAILYCCINGFFIEGKNKIINLVGIFITGYILLVVKVYIIMAFALCLIVALFLNYRGRIKSNQLKSFITPIFIFTALTIGYAFLKLLGENSEAGIYSLDNIMVTAEITRQWITYSEGGSTYSLGKIDNSIWGLIKILPAGINVTLFRPYLWETNNFISVFASLESFVILIITIRIVIKTGLLKIFKIVLTNNIAFFCITFSLIFAFAVGVSTYNFGTLVRYKIPCIPFYLAGLFIANHIAEQEKRKTILLKNLRNKILP